MTTLPSSPSETTDIGALGAPTNPDAVASAARLDPSAAAKLPPRRPAWRRAMSTSPFYMGCVLLGLVVVFSILRPDAFPTMANFRTITLDVAMLQIMAVGMTFVMVGGGFDISIGSILVFSGLVAGKMMEGMADNWWTVIAGTIVCPPVRCRLGPVQRVLHRQAEGATADHDARHAGRRARVRRS